MKIRYLTLQILLKKSVSRPSRYSFEQQGHFRASGDPLLGDGQRDTRGSEAEKEKEIQISEGKKENRKTRGIFSFSKNQVLK